MITDPLRTVFQTAKIPDGSATANVSYMGRFVFISTGALFLWALALASVIHGQYVVARSSGEQQEQNQAKPSGTTAATLQGVVRDAAGHAVPDLEVVLQSEDEGKDKDKSQIKEASRIATVRTDTDGGYRFSGVVPGGYSLRAEKPGLGKAASGIFMLAPAESRTVDFILEPVGTIQQADAAAPPDFFDEPHFTVAGVTDTTNLGGHGSDIVVRSREALAQATASMAKDPTEALAHNFSNPANETLLRENLERQPDDFEANRRLGKMLVDNARAREAIPYLERAVRLESRDFDIGYELAVAYAEVGDGGRARSNAQALLAAPERSSQEAAELHHLLGKVAEKSGDALQAVHEYQRAAEMNPSEANLFDWGTELLTHHAAEPAIQVFTKGSGKFPGSVRMRAGLGAAYYSLGSYDKAAQILCEASDLNPEDPNLYLFMGKMESVESTYSPAIAEHLARFARLQPQNAMADYLYAVSLYRGRKSADDLGTLNEVKSRLQKAVELDPKLSLAYLQLGIVYSERKDFPKAISAYEHAIRISPEMEQAHYRLAQAYRQSGESSKAHAEVLLYQQISQEKTEETERQRHELQQFVFQMRDGAPNSQ